MLTILSNDAQRSYSSTQISAPKNIAEKIKKWCKNKIPESSVYQDSENSLGREGDIHVTVKYGIHTEDHEEIKKIIENFGPVSTKLGKVSKFSSDDYDVIKIEVESEKLHKLNKLIADKTKCTDKFPVYDPHCTICYVKKGSCDDLLGSKEFSGLNWVSSYILFSDKDSKKTIIRLN